MLEQFEAVGTIYFTVDPSDGEAMFDAYAVVTADVEYEEASNDCPASCNYKVNPEFTVHYEGTAEEIAPAMLKGCEFEIYTYVTQGFNPKWKTVRYKNLNDLIYKEKLSIDWN
jgi:hypothetical protein